jgi:hypothetical protein
LESVGTVVDGGPGTEGGTGRAAAVQGLGATMSMGAVGRLGALDRLVQTVVWDQLMQNGQARSGGPSGKQLSAVDLGHATIQAQPQPGFRSI